jgi:hypothetical protein
MIGEMTDPSRLPSSGLVASAGSIDLTPGELTMACVNSAGRGTPKTPCFAACALEGAFDLPVRGFVRRNAGHRRDTGEQGNWKGN